MIPAIRPSIQLSATDCGLTALEILLGIPYAEIRTALDGLGRKRTGRERGMYHTELCATAKALGRPLRKLRAGRCDLEDATGILTINENHYVVLFEGIVVNPADGMLYNREVYLGTDKRPGALFVLDDGVTS